MHKSTIKLPSLRPATPGTARKERNVFGLTGTNARPNTDYEVNRTIFQDMKPTENTDVKKKKKVKPKKLDPIKKNKDNSSISSASSNKTEVVQEQQDPTTQQNPELVQIELLMARIPTAETEVSSDVIFKITPVLDRVLCIVSSFQCIDYIDDPIIAELFKRLFALIEVDDFLTRIIICRILLLFVNDETSSLILPISRIFYKLSCDPSNDDYFVNENLDSVLVSILRMKNVEASLIAAGSIRNLAAYEPMRAKICEKDDLFNYIFDTFNDKNNLNEEMKIQLLGIVRKMSKSALFKGKILESNFLSLAFADKNATLDVLKTVNSVGDLTEEGKQDFIEWFIETVINDENKDIVLKCLPIITNGMEKTEGCGKLMAKMVKAFENDHDALSQILPIMNRCCDNENCLATCERMSDLFTGFVQSTELETNVRIEAYKIVIRFPESKYDHIQKEFKFLNALIKH